MRLLLATPLAMLLLSPLAGCNPADAPGAAPPEAPGAVASGFDPQAWLAQARGLVFDPEASDYDSAETLRAKALAAELDDAVGWKRACDTYVDPETGAAVYEPLEDDGAGWTRGTLDVGSISSTEAVVAVTCDFGAYQGTYALVHIRGDRATLLRAPALGEDGKPMEASQTAFSTVEWDGLEDRRLATLGLARGLGDCGTFVSYDLASGDSLAVREVRQRDCGDDIPDPLPEPEAWPLVYEAR